MEPTSPEKSSGGISRNARLIAAAGGGLLLIYLIVMAWTGIPTGIQVDPKQVALLARQLTDYSLPAGYVERAATTIAGVDRILFDDAGEQNTIWLISGGIGGDTPDAELRQGITFPKYRNLQWQMVDTRPETIRGQAIAVTTYTGSDANGAALQAWACAFQGKSGPAILVIAGLQSGWDDARAQAFVDSMH